jgi:pimeloyl-ACP methyl ester carboxylesterase
MVYAVSAGTAWAYEDVPHASLVSAKPGTVFQMSAFEDGLPAEYKGYRIVYRSTGFKDEPIAVTGAVFFPAASEAGASRPIVAWAHGTTGVVTPCAPTLKPGLVQTIQGIELFASKGYVVVAPDYPGLGSSGDHPYLIGESAAHAVLDSVRAARSIAEARAGDRFIVWGHSQGGHAALFTGMQAHAYAPELKLTGVAAAAPVSRPFDVLSMDTAPFSGRLLSALLYSAWSRLFGFPLSKYVHENKVATFAALGANCLQSAEDLAKIEADETALEMDFFKSDPLKDPFIVGIMAENTAGALPKGMPVFLAQGTNDDTVNPSITQGYAKEVCAGGSKLKLHIMDGVGHVMAAHNSAALAAEWMDTLFNGREPPNEC